MTQAQPALIKFDNYTFRASSVGKLMGDLKPSPNQEWQNCKDKIAEFEALQSNAKSKETDTYINRQSKIDILKKELIELDKFKDDIDPILPDTATSYLKELYVQKKYGIKKDITSKYFEKGKAVEDIAIDMYGELHDKPFSKCKEPRKYNEYFEGECDVKWFESDLYRLIVDMKNRWDLFTYQPLIGKEIEDNYWWQGDIYMELYNGTHFRLVSALMNMPNNLIEDECKRILWQFGSNMEESKEYQDACAEFLKKCTFDHLDLRERFYEIEVKRDEKRYKQAVERAILCRKWLNKYSISEFIRVYGIEEYKKIEPLAIIDEPKQNKFVELMEVEIPNPELDNELVPVSDLPEDEEIGENHENVENEIYEEHSHLVINTDIVENEIKQKEVGSNTKYPQNIDSDEKLKVLINSCNNLEDCEKLFNEYKPIFESSQDLTNELSNRHKNIERLKQSNQVSKPEETESEYTSFIKQINDCNNVDEVRALYKVLLPHFTKYTDLKEKLTIKRDSYNVAAPTPPPVEQPKPTATPSRPKPTAQPKAEPKQETVTIDTLYNELIEKAKLCKSQQELKDKVSKPNQEYIIKNKSLQDELTKIALKLPAKAAINLNDM